MCLFVIKSFYAQLNRAFITVVFFTSEQGRFQNLLSDYIMAILQHNDMVTILFPHEIFIAVACVRECIKLIIRDFMKGREFK